MAEFGTYEIVHRRGLDLYVKRFHEKRLDCCNQIDEEVIVDLYLHDMNEEYRVFHKNFSFLSFSKLMEASRPTNESVRRTLKLSRTVNTARPFPKKRAMIVTIEKSQEAEPSNQRKPLTGETISALRQRESHILLYHPLPCSMKKAAALLRRAAKVSIVHSSFVAQVPTQQTRRIRTVVPITAKKGHTLDQS